MTSHISVGTAIGLGKGSVVMLPGRHHSEQVIDLRSSNDALLVSAVIANRRNRELGRNYKYTANELSISNIHATLDGLRPYFGKNLGAIRHPQFRNAIKAIEAAIKDKVDGEHIVLSDKHIAELYTLSNTIKQWRRSPYLKKFIAEYKADYIHASCLAAAARNIVDQGNDLELVQEVQDKRSPDLVLAPSWNTRVSTEIKAPERLRKGSPLSYEEAKLVVDRAFKSAGTQEGGQLSPDNQGLLIIGSFYLDSTSLNMLVKAAENDFKRTSSKRKHILAAVFINIDRVISRNSEGLIYGVQPALRVEAVHNHEYNQNHLVGLIS